jgi:hypothetical protein
VFVLSEGREEEFVDDLVWRMGGDRSGVIFLCL